MASILIVDDDAQTRSLIQVILESANHVLLEARNGAQALEVLASSSVDLVITDIYMPDMDGLEVIRAVRRRRPPVKVLAYSGGSNKYDFDVLTVAKAFGAHSALPKPFSVSELLSAVHQVLAVNP